MKNILHRIFALSLGFVAVQGNAVAQQYSADDSSNSVVDRSVREFSAMYYLPSLRDEKFNRDEYEIRVWYGFSIFPTSGFFFSRRGNAASSSFVTGVLKSPTGLPARGNNSYDPPSELNRRELEAALVSLLTDKFTRDPGWGDPDSVDVAVEAKKGSDYRIIKYSVDSESKDGKKFLDYVGKLERACGVKLLPDPAKQD